MFYLLDWTPDERISINAADKVHCTTARSAIEKAATDSMTAYRTTGADIGLTHNASFTKALHENPCYAPGPINICSFAKSGDHASCPVLNAEGYTQTLTNINEYHTQLSLTSRMNTGNTVSKNKIWV